VMVTVHEAPIETLLPELWTGDPALVSRTSDW